MKDEMLRELYSGRIRPFAMRFEKDEKTSAITARSLALEQEITELLDEAGKEKFTEFMKADGDLEDVQRFQVFCCGYRIGARLMLDTFADEPVVE